MTRRKKERSEIAESEHIPRTGETDPFSPSAYTARSHGRNLTGWIDSLAVERSKAMLTWVVSYGLRQPGCSSMDRG